MKRAVIILILLFALGNSLKLHGQNNEYQIHDECYSYLLKAESASGTPEFKLASDSLLACAREHNDTRAESLYYTAALRDAVKLQLDPEQQDILVDEALPVFRNASPNFSGVDNFKQLMSLDIVFSFQ